VAPTVVAAPVVELAVWRRSAIYKKPRDNRVATVWSSKAANDVRPAAFGGPDILLPDWLGTDYRMSGAVHVT